MVLPLICVFVFPVAVVFIVRAIYLIAFKLGGLPTKRKCTKSTKTLIVLGSGGHTTEIIRIVKHLDRDKYTPRVYVQAQTDEISSNKVKELESDAKDYKLIQIARSREVRQSYFTSIFTTVWATLQSFPLIWREKPDLLLCNGPGTCVPICLVAFFFNALFLLDTKIVFIESFCRVKTFSLSGKILYYFANHIIVQWPYLSGEKYTRSIIMSNSTIAAYVPWELLKKDLQEYIPNELKFHLNQVLLKLENVEKEPSGSTSSKKVKLCSNWIDHDVVVIEACIDRTWEMLNSGYWKDVPVNYRYCYSLCSIIKVILLEKRINHDDKVKSLDKLKEIIQQIDKGILLGAPLPNSPNLLTEIASKLNEQYSKVIKCDTESKNVIKVDEENLCTSIFPGFSSIIYYTKPSMEKFYCDIFKPKVPALLGGCIEHWQALNLWQNVDYLKQVAGNRTVPVEIGSRYTEDDWTQNLVTFSEFLNKHIFNKNDHVGYLAQHQLFDQIPEMKKDFSVPDYCSFSDQEDNEDSPDINAWFGPSGTVSPLHCDPKNNLLCQVFGYKRIILYSTKDNENVYPYESRMLCNTSQVDPYNPDFEKFPNFQNAKGYMCYLKPGDILFIPPKWWHHVVSLSPSFSVSFWWD